MHILVTGGAGYIGSHTCLELLAAGYRVTVIDSLVNAKEEAIRRVEQLAGQSVRLAVVDLRDRDGVRQLLADSPEPVDSVIHFAGLKAVGESVEKPLLYYQNNLTSTLTLCEVMLEFGIRRLIFSSSATVYGDPATVPITEDFPLSCTNPYGRTKLMIEDILRDINRAEPTFQVALLRYFNPVGAHHSGQIGEDPAGLPNNLTPYITKVLIGELAELQVFGNDYPTPDGTGVRDYIHVIDLARGHVKALTKLQENPGLVTYNLGTGRGYSVLDVIRAYEEVSGKTVSYRIAPRRPGDIAACWADPSKAARELGWQAQLGLKEMCRDSWNWQLKNPTGY
ncbi:UDP-glucose 4-epimerase GalE [Desulfofustis glycolicus]|uniref:UDP-glucose 4-epimerase n=1 Tax=Desulfofustis glycolicus DSM 9705 TaxID=1121409 RepID=A0A1M5SD31_9BACT|nr:UDP-glucose 4-epimerase GalE [Desulfofustis glycolicus]MCB2216149.1 UDP-glucose 4-epimerase GalE [Desulfobulbaceae bacterium]SHH36360.1 UDP-galactose 4-epimerase [Desulfofustis glycolicus DSM 9705]